MKTSSRRGFKLLLTSIIVATCLAQGEHVDGGIRNGNLRIVEKVQEVLKKSVDSQSATVAQGEQRIRKRDRVRDAMQNAPWHSVQSHFTTGAKVILTDEDFESTLDEAGEKMTFINFFYSRQKSPISSKMVMCINRLAKTYPGVVWIVVDAFECEGAAEKYAPSGLFPIYVFIMKNMDQCSCEWHNNERDCSLIEHKTRELLGLTKVQVVVDEKDFTNKLSDAGSKSVLVFFTDKHVKDSDYSVIISDLEEFTKTYPNMVIIEADIITCPSVMRIYGAFNKDRPVFAFIKEMALMDTIADLYLKENINNKIKELIEN